MNAWQWKAIEMEGSYVSECHRRSLSARRSSRGRVASVPVSARCRIHLRRPGAVACACRHGFLNCASRRHETWPAAKWPARRNSSRRWPSHSRGRTCRSATATLAKLSAVYPWPTRHLKPVSCNRSFWVVAEDEFWLKWDVIQCFIVEVMMIFLFFYWKQNFLKTWFGNLVQVFLNI